MAVVFGAIAPHGWLAIPELCAPGDRELAAATRAGMVELGRRLEQSAAETTVVLTPHNIHVEGALAVVEAARIEGSLDSEDPAQDPIALAAAVDRELALAVRADLRSAGLPVVGVSWGANDPEDAVMPMDWATLIPLWYLGGRRDSPPGIVVIAPARELPASEHVRAGAVIAAAAERVGRRIAVLASADHGHGHRADGPYGFSAASQPFDEQVVNCVSSGRLDALLDLDRKFVDEARADSWWQMLMLHGALQAADTSWSAELHSYEAPTYFGMLCASFAPPDPAASA